VNRCTCIDKGRVEWRGIYTVTAQLASFADNSAAASPRPPGAGGQLTRHSTRPFATSEHLARARKHSWRAEWHGTGISRVSLEPHGRNWPAATNNYSRGGPSFFPMYLCMCSGSQSRNACGEKGFERNPIFNCCLAAAPRVFGSSAIAYKLARSNE
jgi:hypothetical protein